MWRLSFINTFFGGKISSVVMNSFFSHFNSISQSFLSALSTVFNLFLKPFLDVINPKCHFFKVSFLKEKGEISKFHCLICHQMIIFSARVKITRILGCVLGFMTWINPILGQVMFSFLFFVFFLCKLSLLNASETSECSAETPAEMLSRRHAKVDI